MGDAPMDAARAPRDEDEEGNGGGRSPSSCGRSRRRREEEEGGRRRLLVDAANASASALCAGVNAPISCGADAASPLMNPLPMAPLLLALLLLLLLLLPLLLALLLLPLPAPPLAPLPMARLPMAWLPMARLQLEPEAVEAAALEAMDHTWHSWSVCRICSSNHRASLKGSRGLSSLNGSSTIIDESMTGDLPPQTHWNRSLPGRGSASPTFRSLRPAKSGWLAALWVKWVWVMGVHSRMV